RRARPPRRRPPSTAPSTLQRLESRQHIGPVEEPDVLRLRPRQAAHGPREVHEVRLVRRAQGMHAHFFGQEVALAGVAARAGGQDVRPGVRAAPREGDEMVARQALPLAQLLLRAATELAAVVIAGKQERVGDLATEAAGDVEEADQPNDRRPGYGHALRMNSGALSLTARCLTS